jgi:hypothetical protein
MFIASPALMPANAIGHGGLIDRQLSEKAGTEER